MSGETEKKYFHQSLWRSECSRVQHVAEISKTYIDIVFPYKEAITKSLRLSIILIDHSSNKRGQLPSQSFVSWLGKESQLSNSHLFTLW